MNYEAMINDFIDGSLSAEGESGLFMALANDEELRGELKESLRMEKAFARDASELRPSSASGAKIFKTLGVAIPGAAAVTAGATAASGLGAKIASFFSGVSGAAISSAVTAVVVATATFLATGPLDLFGFRSGGNDGGDRNSTAFVANDDGDASAAVEKNEDIEKIPTTASEEIREPKVIVKYVDRPIYVYKEVEKPVDLNENLAGTLASGRETPIRIETSKPTYKTNLDAGPKFRISNFDLPEAAPTLEFEAPKTLIGIKAEAAGSHYLSLPRADVSRSSYPALNNTSLTLLYDISDRFSIGANIRQEYFYQKYYGFEIPDGYDVPVEFEYRQHTNYLSGGIVGRYALAELFPDMKLYLQGSAGFNRAGVVGRIMPALEYSPGANVGFLLGLEGSVLGYRNDGDIYSSQKLGVHYGVNVKF